MMNSLSLPPYLALLRAQAYFAERPKLLRGVIWFAVLTASLIVMLLATQVGAQDLNKLTEGTAAALACTQAQDLTKNKWLKVFILIGFGLAVANIARKQRDGWTNLIWIVVVASLLGSVWQIAKLFGITC